MYLCIVYHCKCCSPHRYIMWEQICNDIAITEFNLHFNLTEYIACSDKILGTKLASGNSVSCHDLHQQVELYFLMNELPQKHEPHKVNNEPTIPLLTQI